MKYTSVENFIFNFDKIDTYICVVTTRISFELFFANWMLSLFWSCSTFFSAAFQKISPSSCSPLFHFFTWHNQVSIPPPSPLPFNHFPFSCFSFSALFFTLDPLLFFFIVFSALFPLYLASPPSLAARPLPSLYDPCKSRFHTICQYKSICTFQQEYIVERDVNMNPEIFPLWSLKIGNFSYYWPLMKYVHQIEHIVEIFLYNPRQTCPICQPTDFYPCQLLV